MLSPPSAARWRRATRTRCSQRSLKIRFANPVSARPFVGHDVLAIVVPRLLDTWKDLRYVA
jgi:hypothetical protein